MLVDQRDQKKDRIKKDQMDQKHDWTEKDRKGSSMNQQDIQGFLFITPNRVVFFKTNGGRVGEGFFLGEDFCNLGEDIFGGYLKSEYFYGRLLYEVDLI